MGDEGLQGRIEELREALAQKTAERNRFCEALMAVLCATSLAHARQIVRNAFREAGRAAIQAKERSDGTT